MNIVIVDDHPIVREGLATALARCDDFAIAGEFASAEELFASRVAAEVVLLDLELPGMSGVEAVSKIDAAVLVLTAYANDEQIDAVLRAGARGYLLKGATLAEIEHAIRAVARDASCAHENCTHHWRLAGTRPRACAAAAPARLPSRSQCPSSGAAARAGGGARCDVSAGRHL